MVGWRAEQIEGDQVAVWGNPERDPVAVGENPVVEGGHPIG